VQVRNVEDVLVARQCGQFFQIGRWFIPARQHKIVVVDSMPGWFGAELIGIILLPEAGLEHALFKERERLAAFAHQVARYRVGFQAARVIHQGKLRRKNLLT